MHLRTNIRTCCGVLGCFQLHITSCITWFTLHITRLCHWVKVYYWWNKLYPLNHSSWPLSNLFVMKNRSLGAYWIQSRRLPDNLYKRSTVLRVAMTMEITTVNIYMSIWILAQVTTTKKTIGGGCDGGNGTIFFLYKLFSSCYFMIT